MEIPFELLVYAYGQNLSRLRSDRKFIAQPAGMSIVRELKFRGEGHAARPRLGRSGRCRCEFRKLQSWKRLAGWKRAKHASTVREASRQAFSTPSVPSPPRNQHAWTFLRHFRFPTLIL